MKAILIAGPFLTNSEAKVMADTLNRAVDKAYTVPFIADRHPDNATQWAVYVRPLYVRHFTVTIPQEGN